MITLQQIRAGRAMLGFKQDELAKKAHISTATLNNIERGVQTDPKSSTLRAIQEALEAGGIEFTQESGSFGVRLKALKAANGPATVLIVDDNDADRKLYAAWLKKQPEKNYILIEADNALAGYEAFLKHKPVCILLDFIMYGLNGFQLLIKMKTDGVKIPPIVFVTAMDNEAIKKDVLSLGVHAYLDKKNLTKENLCQTVAKALVYS